tara:strand:- start:1164 stop:1943 length:780 start_codon:yes stop_codon:yes gene_type:complete
MIKLPKKIDYKKAKQFFKSIGLSFLNDLSLNEIKKKKDHRYDFKAHKPEIIDLYRIYKLITLNKRINVLEYGTGYSSLVIAKALNENKKKYLKNIKNLRFKNKFFLSIIDNEKKFINISKNIIKQNIKFKNFKFFYSENHMTTFNGRLCSHYVNHPTLNPDFIYLDGPDQFNIKRKINGITLNHYEMSPMSCDILKYENLLCPGTIILVDGRSLNSRFLRDNFKRNWKIIQDELYDQTIFYLNEKTLGYFNTQQLKFYK